MLLDAGELVTFYASPLGRMVRRLVGARLRAVWPRCGGQTVVGHGYATPYLGHFQAARHLVGVMPASQGAVRWPTDRPGRVVLAENDQIPLPDESVDRLLAVHSLEGATDPRHQLREFWRVLRAEGRLTVVVPNRRGVWARVDATPFGSGRPYSRGQLDRLLRDALFHPMQSRGALYMPPLAPRLLLAGGSTVERIGSSVWPGFSGVVIVEASKQLMAPLGGGRTAPAAAVLETADRATPVSRKSDKMRARHEIAAASADRDPWDQQ